MLVSLLMLAALWGTLQPYEVIRFFRTRDREIAQTLPAALGDFGVGHF
jgi:hypothetical protein